MRTGDNSGEGENPSDTFRKDIHSWGHLAPLPSLLINSPPVDKLVPSPAHLGDSAASLPESKASCLHSYRTKLCARSPTHGFCARVIPTQL